MKKQLLNLLGAIVRDYFTDHLPRVRGTSPHTIHGYRDSLVLLLRFLSARHKRPIAESPSRAPDSVRDSLHSRPVSYPSFPGCSDSPQEAASPTQHKAQHCRSTSEVGGRPVDDQPLSGSCQSEHDESVREVGSRNETQGDCKGQSSSPSVAHTVEQRPHGP